MALNLSEALTGVDWPSVTGYTVTDTRLIMKLNEAQRRILAKGKYVGTVQAYQICAHANCLTWPRQIETIEAAWKCGYPVSLRNQWFEALPHGYGRQPVQFSCSGDLIDRGRGFCCFDDITTPSQIQLYPTYAADFGQRVLLQGRDNNGNWIRTVNGTVNGVYVTLGPTAYSTALDDSNTPILFAQPGLVAVQKPATRGPVRAFGYDPTGLQPLRALSYWEPDETLPDYRRSVVPGLVRTGLSGTASECNQCGGASITFTVMAKKRFIPVAQGTDFFIIQNLPALKEMVIAIVKAERGLIDEAEAHEARAVRLLEEELSSYEGNGVVEPIKVDGYTFAGGENYLEGGICSWH